MAAKSERSRRITKIVVPENYDIDALRKIMNAMQGKKSPLKPRDIVLEVRAEIEQMLVRKYDWIDIAETIRGTGLDMSPATVRQYAGGNKKNSPKQSPPKPAKNVKTKSAGVPVNKVKTNVATGQPTLNNKIDKAFEQPSGKKTGPAPDIDFGE